MIENTTQANKKNDWLKEIYKEMEENGEIIKEYREKNPFWKRYKKFLDAKKKWVFSKFISLKPKSKLW